MGNRGPRAEQLLVDGEVAYSAAGQARIQKAQRDGAPVAVNWDQGTLTSQSWVIPRGSKHRDAALKFLAFVSDPERQAELSKYIDYGPEQFQSLPVHRQGCAAADLAGAFEEAGADRPAMVGRQSRFRQRATETDGLSSVIVGKETACPGA